MWVWHCIFMCIVQTWSHHVKPCNVSGFNLLPPVVWPGATDTLRCPGAIRREFLAARQAIWVLAALPSA